jgi:two-component system, OmpR family, response regulator
MLSHQHTPRILAIDDDLDTLDLLRVVLKRGGFDISTASSWGEVVDRVNISKQNYKPFDLIILDIMMPDRSGFDIFRSLQVVLDKIPPVIFLSARYSVNDMVMASDLGAAKYLIKPTTPEKLINTVWEVIKQER